MEIEKNRAPKSNHEKLEAVGVDILLENAKNFTD